MPSLTRRLGWLGCIGLLLVTALPVSLYLQDAASSSLMGVGTSGHRETRSLQDIWAHLLEHVISPLVAPRSSGRDFSGLVADREAMRRAGSSSPRFYSFIDSGDPVTGDNDEDEAEGGAVVVESDFAPRRAAWDDDGNELLVHLMGNHSLQGLKRVWNPVRVPANWLKKPVPVAKWGTKATGRAKCPALLRKASDGTCRAQSAGLQPWCLKPMQLISGEKFARFPVSRNTEKGKRREYKTFTTASGPQPVVETFLSHSDIPRGLKFQDFLIHKGNGWAMKVSPKPRPDFVAPHDLPDLFDFSTCAVVGSSSTLLQSEQGKEIDAHSFVMRFNQAPTRRFERHVGSKTSLRLQNQERVGPVPGDRVPTCLVKGYNFRHNKKCTLLALSPQFMLYTKYYWYFHRMPGPGGGAVSARISSLSRDVSRIKMSTGMMGLSLALHLCGKVDLYGFSGGRGHYYQKSAAKRSDATPFEDRHPWPIERACMRTLSTKLQDVHVR
eukprot:jgi/Tetstr1/456237/TSEL_042999.t1